jgi:tRNA A-37 threonylcarbamoyl transferase component Bud32
MDDLKILQKMYDFYLDNYNVINKYPKSEKFTLQTETKSTMLKMIRLIIRASKAKVKKPILFEIDTELETLRILFRLAHNLKFLSNRRYELNSKLLSEIGRLLGGWMRSC